MNFISLFAEVSNGEAHVHLLGSTKAEKDSGSQVDSPIN